MATEKPAGGYGKRPLWQWVLIYVLIGAVVYFGIYYFLIKPRSSGSLYGGSNNTSTQNSGYGY